MDEKWEDIELYKFKGLANEFFYAEVRSFQWMFEKWQEGKIRTQTITNLIPQSRIQNAIDKLAKREQFEWCSVLQEIIMEIYIGEEIDIMINTHQYTPEIQHKINKKK